MRVRAAAAVTLLVAVLASAYLLTYDVYADVPQVYVGQVDESEGSTFCGSAYDVALVKRDGFMGGEVPLNQPEIDQACVEEARVLVGGSGLAFGGWLVAFLWLHLRKPSEEQGRRRELAASSHHAD